MLCGVCRDVIGPGSVGALSGASSFFKHEKLQTTRHEARQERKYVSDFVG